MELRDLLSEMDRIVARIKEFRQLSRELYEEQVTPVDLIQEVEELEKELSTLKDQVRTKAKAMGLSETVSYSLEDIEVSLRVREAVKVNDLVEDLGLSNIPHASDYIEEVVNYKLKKTVPKDVFIEELKKSGIDVDDYVDHIVAVHLKER